MKARFLKTLRFVGMLVLTMSALAIMMYVSRRSDNHEPRSAAQQSSSNTYRPSALVVVRELKPETVEILDTFAGKIRAWEQYSVGFEVSGRVKDLGTNGSGQLLDEGDRVVAGQVLARLDDRVLRARKSEAAAEWEQAKTNLERAKELLARGVGGISETDYLDRLTREAIAKAELEMASKNLEDAVIASPIDAVISKRWIKPGESVTAHAVVFELVETDPILLVVDVPESRVREIEARLQQVERNRRMRDSVAVEPYDLDFLVHVEIESENRFGRKWPPLSGVVHQVAETADLHTGLFEIEVRLANSDRLLKPGMVARASLVTDRISAFRIPATSVLFRHNRASFFTLDEERVDVRAMFWDVGKGTTYRARKVELERYIEQHGEILVPASGQPFRTAVVRGQHRLASGQLVQIIPSENLQSGNVEPDLQRRPPTALIANPH